MTLKNNNLLTPIYRKEGFDNCKDNPFDNEGYDIFQRKDFANILLDLIKNSDYHTIALRANWGDGKTTFVKMLEKKIINDKDCQITPIYIDAFEQEYLGGSILESLLGAIGDAFRAGSLSKYMNVLKDFAANVLKSTKLKINIPFAEVDINKLFDRENKQKSLEHAKNELSSAIGENKLVIIIDELDRCSPKYTLEVLEKVKHIFDIDNIKFIFAINQNELEQIIKKSYGEIDARNYLSKFFQLTLNLPKNENLIGRLSPEKGGSNYAPLYKYLEHKLGEKGVWEIFENNNQYYQYRNNTEKLVLLSNILQGLQLTIREIDLILARFIDVANIFISQNKHLKTSNGDPARFDNTNTCIVALLSFLYLKHPEDFKKLKKNTLTWENLLKYLNQGLSSLTYTESAEKKKNFNRVFKVKK